jgi:predicted peptidase
LNISHSKRAALAFAILIGSCATVHFEPRINDGFLERIDAGRRYYVYRPADWTPDKKWPVIVYLHGADERGADGVKPTQVGLGPWVWQSHGKFPFVVIFPQCASGSFWMYKGEGERVMQAIDRSLKEDAGDPARVYLTGNSLGGYGTWILGAVHADRFAALVPICGGAAPPRGRPLPPEAPFAKDPDPYLAVAQHIGKVPVWAFHGEDDWLVDPKQTKRLVDDLHQLGNDAKMTIYPGVGHNSWDRTYSNPALWDWLAQQRRAN